MSSCGWNASAAGRSGLRNSRLSLGMALLLIVLGLALDGCRKKSAAPSPPTTTFTLIGQDVATVTLGNRLGPAPPRNASAAIDLLDPNAMRLNGATIHFSSNLGGITFYILDQAGCAVPPGAFTPYDPKAPPPVPVATSTGQGVPVSEAWDLCYYSIAGGLQEGQKHSFIYFDTMTPEILLLDSKGKNRFLAGALPFTEFPMLQPVYNEDPIAGAVDASAGVLLPPGTTQISTTQAFFPGEGGTIYYTTDGSNPITPLRAQVFGLTASPSIQLLKGVGKGLFPFSSSQRLVKVVSVDDVGNESPPTPFTIPLDLVTTDPSAGYYHIPQDILLTPPVKDFVQANASAAFLRLCQYTTLGGYQCATPPTLGGFGGSLEVDAAITDFIYTFGVNPPTDNPTFNLSGAPGQTTVYDLKIRNDSYLGDGALVTDADHQALFILDRDLPVLKVYPDPDKTTDSVLTVGASWFDDGYFVVKEANITDYSVTRTLNTCTTIIDPVTLLDACVKPVAPTVTLPASPSALPSDNAPVQVTVSATDAAGNVAQAASWQPVGRSYAEGSGAAVSANLGSAMAAGNFNTVVNSIAVPEIAPDYAIAEPSKNGGIGSVYIFYEDVRTQVSFASANTTAPAPFVSLPTLIDAVANNTLVVTTTVNGVTVGPIAVDLTARAFLATPNAVGQNTLAEIADAFNKAVMSLAHQGTDLGVYMVATNFDKDAQNKKDSVALISDTGQIDTCVTVGASALQALLQLPAGMRCVWDERIDGLAAGDQFGHGVAVGDFNNDGYDDLAIGAPGANGGTGEVYIFYSLGAGGATQGKFGGAQYDIVTTAAASTTITGAAAGDDFGWSVAAGDLEPNVGDLQFVAGVDVKDDLLVGAPGVTVTDGGGTPHANAGRIYIFRAPAAGAVALPPTSNSANPSFFLDNPRIAGLAFMTGERFGHAVLVANLDVNASAPSDEFVVGAPGVRFLQDTAISPGAAYYYSFFFNPSLGFLLNAPNGATGPNIDSKYGWALGNAGVLYQDFCGPNSRCIAVGAPGAFDGAGTPKGAAYIAPGALFAGTVGAGAFRVLGENSGDYMGTGFASADLNGDTFPELIIGQGGSLSKGGAVTSFYGGVGIVLGGAHAPGVPGTPLTLDRHFTNLDVDPVTGAKAETRIGGPILATAADPINQGGTITRLIVGAPGGQERFFLAQNVPGRLHVFRRATFNY